jgi:hypothetical protein
VGAAQSRVKFEFQQLPDSAGSNFGCCLFCGRQGADDLKLLSDFLTSHLNFSLQDTFIQLFRQVESMACALLNMLHDYT